MGIDAPLGRANVAIRATLDKLDGDLADAKGKVDTVVSKITHGAGESFKKLGSVALGGIGVATGAVAGLAAALGKITVDAAPLEGLSSAFEGLAESAGYGTDEMLAALKRGSAGMVSNRDLMMSFNKAAQLVSVDFATKLPDAMQHLVKVSAATGADMGYLLDSLVTGVGRLSPMILDNLGIQVSLAEATDRAAEMFGVEAGELTKAQQQAGMMNVILEKLAANTANIDDVTESAAAKMARFKATIQDTKDRIGMALLPILTQLFGIFQTAADKYLPTIISWMESFGGTLYNVFDAVARAVGIFQNVLASTGDPLEALRVALVSLGLNLGIPAEKVQALVDRIVAFIGKAQEILAPIVAWISENVKLQDVLIVLGAAIASVVLPVLWGIVTAVAPVIAAFVAAMAIVVALRKAWESDFLGIKSFVQNTLSTIRKWWDEHGAQVTSTVSAMWATISNTVTTIFNAVKSFIDSALQTIRDWWRAHGDAIMALAENAWNTIKTIVDTIIHNVQEIIAAVSDAIKGDWEGFGEHLRNIWDNCWNAIKSILGDAWDSIKTIVGEIISGIKSAFTDTDWGALGRAVVDGITGAIKSGIQKVIDAVIALAQAAWDAVEGFFRIKSPSGLFADAGEAVVAGFVKGIRNSKVTAVAEVRATMEHVAAAGLAGGEMGGATSETNIYVTPHYYRGDEPSLSEELRMLALSYGV